MKKIVLLIVLLFSVITVKAQFYVAANTGVTAGVHKKVLGEKTNLLTGSSEELKGSFGAGIHNQLRLGYFFNEKIGAELGVGYLYGFDQNGTSIRPGILEINSRARVFGASLSGIYNFNDYFYGKLGAIIKVGGKTETVSDLYLSNALTGLGGDIEADFTTDFQGELPIGVIAALGLKQVITDNLSAFIELEYMNINVTRDNSSLNEFSATLGGGAIDAATLSGILTASGFTEVAVLLQEDVQWGENGLPATEAPYSSLGLNFGIIYSF